jgi:hypothetical protein
MSVQERLALMEELWASFDRDALEYPVPRWHEEILNRRQVRDNVRIESFEDAKQEIYEALRAYRNS